MSTILLAIVAVIYAGTALAFFIERKPDLALIFASYAVAQLGFIWSNVK